MRSIETGFRSYLDGLTETNGATVWVNAAEQGTVAPFVVINVVDTDNFDSLGPADDSLRAETFNLTVYHTTAAKARTMSDAIEEALDDFTGAMGSDRVAQNVFFPNATADYTPPEVVVGFHLCNTIVTIQHAPAA
jgi:hypothetical protein